MTQTSMTELTEACTFLKEHLSLNDKSPVSLGVVLGSGLTPYAEELKKHPQAKCVPFGKVPHLSPSTVPGHKGEIIYSQTKNGAPILCLSGRLHFYEGNEPHDVVFPIRVMSLLGVKTIILTNASGAIADRFQAGQLMAINDHLNLTGHSPLVGPNIDTLGPRFVDMTTAYDKELIVIAENAARSAQIKMHQGIYAGVLGPCYETPAEVRMLKMLGADAVGMSTIYETMAARHVGMKVLAICCLSNKAAGLIDQKITHEEVIEKNAEVAEKFQAVLVNILDQLAK